MHTLRFLALLGVVGCAGGGTQETADTSAPAADDWDGFARGFFADYCVSCHDGGTRDLSACPDVVRDAAVIRCGVASTEVDGCGLGAPAPQQFPVGSGPEPTTDERDRLVAWIDAGEAGCAR